MSYFPDCREDMTYNQDFLKATDKQFVRGYDWCSEEAVDNFFDNLDVYMEDSDPLYVMLQELLPEDETDEYEVERTFGGAVEHRTVETYGDKLRAAMMDWLESRRNEMITAMIDDMTQKDYDAAVKAAQTAE